MTVGPVARLGHVLGWTGNAIAVLIVMAAAAVIGLHAKDVWMLRKAPVAYEIELPSGRTYCTLSANPKSTEQDAFDAAAAADAGRPVPRSWTVHAAGELDGEELRKWRDVIRRYSPAARGVAMVNAWKSLAFAAAALLLLAVLAFFAGRALRYIFAGPSR
ncbi:MAG: hypothetical protein WCJ41_00260 [Aestuariivirga sp.]|uniref:hypothetical protein n=1 Tax=Aestuariivirga sp. TaxID=2650926 RepID=UPI00301AB01B